MIVRVVSPTIEIAETGKFVNYSPAQVFAFGLAMSGFVSHIPQEEIQENATKIFQMTQENKGFVIRSIITAVLSISSNDIASLKSDGIYLGTKRDENGEEVEENSFETGMNIINLLKPELGLSLLTLRGKRMDQLTRAETFRMTLSSLAHQAFCNSGVIDSNLRDIELAEINLNWNTEIFAVLKEPIHVIEGK